MIDGRIQNIYRRRVTGVRTSATYDDLTFLQVELGHYVHVLQVVARDATTATVAVSFLVVTLGADYPVAHLSLADITVPGVTQVDFWMHESDKLVARFYDGASSDILSAYAYGVEHTADLEIGA